MAFPKITYADKSNVIPVVDRPTQATAEDFNEIKEVINALSDQADIVGTPGFIYVAFASDDAGSDFTTTFDVTLTYMAIKKSATAIAVPAAPDFAGLWRFIMPEAPTDGIPYVRQDSAWIELPGVRQLVYSIYLPAEGTIAERCAGAVEIQDYPENWILDEDTDPANMSITHNLNRDIAEVKILFEDNGVKRILMGNLAYSGWFAPTKNRLVIENMTQKNLVQIGYPILIQLIFA